MPKANVLELIGEVLEISEPKFLQNGAEVQTFLIGWEDGDYKQQAAVDFYHKTSLDKLHALNIKVGENITIPCQPSSKVKEGEGARGHYRFFQTMLRGDSYKVVVNSARSVAADIPF